MSTADARGSPAATFSGKLEIHLSPSTPTAPPREAGSAMMRAVGRSGKRRKYAGGFTDSPAANPMKYISTFSHANEKVTAGSYGVNLDNGAKVELSATQRTGAGRFTWPVGPTSTLLVNVSGSIMGTDDASVTIGKNYISGYAASGHF